MRIPRDTIASANSESDSVIMSSTVFSSSPTSMTVVAAKGVTVTLDCSGLLVFRFSIRHTIVSRKARLPTSFSWPFSLSCCRGGYYVAICASSRTYVVDCSSVFECIQDSKEEFSLPLTVIDSLNPYLIAAFLPSHPQSILLPDNHFDFSILSYESATRKCYDTGVCYRNTLMEHYSDLFFTETGSPFAATKSGSIVELIPFLHDGEGTEAQRKELLKRIQKKCPAATASFEDHWRRAREGRRDEVQIYPVECVPKCDDLEDSRVALLVPDARCTLFLQYTTSCARVLLYDAVGDDWIVVSTIDLRRSRGSTFAVSYNLENQTLHVSVGTKAVDVDVGFLFHSSERKEIPDAVWSKQSPSEEELYAMIQAVLRE